MKKILLSITVLLMTFGIISKVEAKSYNIALNGNSSFDNEITITMQINNQKDMSIYCNGICGLMATLKYDSSKIELIKVTELNNFEITHNSNDGTIIIERDSGTKDGTSIGTLKFRNKALNSDESTTISLTNLTGTDGESDISTQNVSKTIKYVKKTTTNNSTTPNNTNKKEEPKKSNNNYLSSLNIDSMDIDFNKEKLIYDIVVEYNIDKIVIDAKTEDKNATIEGTGEHKLNIGKNSIKILVKAEDKTEREYILNINREEQNIELEENNSNDTTIEKNDDTITIKKKDLIIIVVVTIIILIISFSIVLKRKK